MSVYLDASVLVSLFSNDAFTARSQAFLRGQAPTLIFSDLGAAEVASAVSRQARIGARPIDEARLALSTFDTWTVRAAQRVLVQSADIAIADSAMRRLDLTLRTADAIHIAIAGRIGAELATFDVKMAESARMLGVSIAPI